MKRRIVFAALAALLVLALAPGARAASGAASTVQQFYGWYVKNQASAQRRLSEQRAWLTPELYSALASAYQKTPRNSKQWLEFDPFITLGEAISFTVGQTTQRGSSVAMVPVDLTVRARGSAVQHLTVLLKRGGDGTWRIDNVLYDGQLGDLRSQLRRVNGH